MSFIKLFFFTHPQTHLSLLTLNVLKQIFFTFFSVSHYSMEYPLFCICMVKICWKVCWNVWLRYGSSNHFYLHIGCLHVGNNLILSLHYLAFIS